jgi:hypothetical protein
MLLTTWAATACAPRLLPRAQAPGAFSDGLSKCSVSASQTSPLVTEWPASEKANLQASLAQGAVAVAYSGCSMKLVRSCKIKGRYRWQRTTIATDSFEVKSADELYAKLPLGAVRLEAELSRSGRLEMQTTVAGQMKLEPIDLDSIKSEGACDGVTHIVDALSIGAFTLRSGGALKANAGVSVSVAGAKAGTQSSEKVMRSAGDPASCKQGDADKAHHDCASPIQVFLQELPSVKKQRGPQGSIKVHFESRDADTHWEVLSSAKKLCETPCSKWVLPAQTLILKEKGEDFLFFKKKRLAVPDLADHASQAPLIVSGSKNPSGQWLAGVALTGLGGTAALAGTVLTAVGLGKGGPSDPLVTPGALSLGAGAAVLTTGLVLIYIAPKQVQVRRIGLEVDAQGVGLRF